MTVAVMGCVVNGPGESKMANVGISLPGTGEMPVAPVYVDGQKTVTLKGDRIARGIRADRRRLRARDLRRRAGRGAPAPGTQVDRDPRSARTRHRVARARTRRRALTPRRVSQRAQTGPPARSTDNVATHNAVAFLDGGGEMGARMRAYDWTTTPLGPPHTWTQSLRTIVRVMLDSRYAMWMLWGPDLTFFCNDAYLPTVGIKRDWVLGARSDKVWAEIWPDIGPRIEHVLNTGEATWDEGLLLFLERSGYPEETYHTFSYSPVYDDDATVAGMLCVVTEDTERQLSERRMRICSVQSAPTWRRSNRRRRSSPSSIAISDWGSPTCRAR